MVRFCPTVEVAKEVALPFASETAFAPLFDNVIAPVNRFSKVSVIALLPALKLDVPGTIKLPICVIAPVAVIVKFCPTVDVAKLVAVLFVSETAFEPLLLSVIVPVRLLALVNVNAPAPAVNETAPAVAP